MNRTAIFDLDGTLVDSLPDIHAALNRLMESRGLPAFGRETVRGFIGDGVPVLLARAFAAHGTAPDTAALADFLADYEPRAAELTRPFEGIPELVAALAGQGWRLAVCTNKPARAAELLLEGLGMRGAFAALGGGDSFPFRKPDPRHLLATLEAAGGQAEGAIMLGDHHNDVAAAEGAGLPAIFCAWGYGTPAMAGHAAIAHSPAEALALLQA